MTTPAPSGLTRRELLARTGWVAAGVTVLTSCARILPPLPTQALPSRDEALVWLQLLPDGRVRFLCPRSEMGQGILTGLTQVVAEELDLPAERIDCIQPRTDQIAPTVMTVGSWSMAQFFEPVARAAAALRETLRARAAAEAGVAPAAVRSHPDGFVLPDGRQVRYAELASQGVEVVHAEDVDATPRVLDPAREPHRVGRAFPLVGARAVVTGSETYSRDVGVDGMVYGAVARPPRAGATVLRYDADAAHAAGAIQIVADEDGGAVGLVGASPFQLQAALGALAVEWSGGEAFDEETLAARLDVDAALAADDFEHTLFEDGDLAEGAAAAARTLDARYDSPIWCHAAMEPRAAVASVTDSRVDVWTASQDPWLMQGLVAERVGRSREDVVVHNHRIGGAFGGRALCQAAVEAAWLSDAVRQPVRVQWSREDEFWHNNVGPQFSHRIRAGLDGDGRICCWDDAFVSCPIIFTSSLVPERLHWLVDFPADPGTGRNAEPPYALPARRVRSSDVRIPIVTGAWRGLGASPNAFAVESAVDELAVLAGADPLEFRIAHADPEQPRLTAVLRDVADLSGWTNAPPRGVGRGVACGMYKDETYVAVVAEVERTRGDGWRVRRVFCSHDCGRVVSPDQVRAQIEGNVAWGCSVALHERARVADGAIATLNFDSYPILRHEEMPEVEISLLEPPGVPPAGAGEAALVPSPAAIANALFAATGQRVRRLPLELGG